MSKDCEPKSRYCPLGLLDAKVFTKLILEDVNVG
jgi:hypothetical protein